ncbi:MAG: HPr family phosphocarrier protein [Candidatus Zixiibacteriota bacterium]
MKTGHATITNRLGLHARPSAMVVERATSFESEVWIEKEGLKINAKSIMGVMMLAAEQGAELIVTTEGPDEAKALTSMQEVLSSGFGEISESS